METIPRHHFNQDLDDYVKQRRSYGKRPLFGLGKKPEPTHLQHAAKNEHQKKGVLRKLLKGEKAPMHADIPEEHVKRVLANQPMTDDEQEVEVEESAPSRQEGFFTKLKNAFFSPKQEEEEPFMIQPPKKEDEPVDADVVEVLKISGRWLNRLDPETKQEFKSSTDYAKYKFFVDKVNKKR